jgi:DNA-binding response OmpR family regulator
MLLLSSDLRLVGCERIALRVALESHDTALAIAVQRILESSGQYEVAWASTTDLRTSHSTAPDVVLILGSTASARLRIRQRREAGWIKGLAVAAEDTRPETASACLEAGADDYIRLPLDSKEFLSRIHALARRANPFTVTKGAVKLDSHTYVATIGDWQASLKKTSFRLVAYLTERAGQWTRTQDLQVNVLQACCRAGASNVRWHVLEARRALGPMRWCLHSDSQRGYMLDMQPCGFSHCRRKRMNEGA